MNLVFEYIKYRWKAKGRHGTHSPFIYQFVDECLKTSINSSDLIKLKNFQQGLKNDTRIIDVQDFGAGSKQLTSKRSIRSIFKISSSKGKFAHLFYQLAKYYQAQNSLEFGTSLGVGTVHFALGNPISNITTVEACKTTAKIAQENFDALALNQIELHNTTFADFLQHSDDKKYDIVFIDGHHDGEATITYINQLDDKIHDDTFLIIDDIRWSNSMFTCWQKLVQDNRFHVSIDLFRMGILLKRSKQRKEHFTIKL